MGFLGEGSAEPFQGKMRPSGRDAVKEGSLKTDAAIPALGSSLTGQPSPGTPVKKDQPSTSKRELPDEILFLSDYLTELSDTDWVAFSQATTNPMTKVQFFTLCLTLMRHASLSAVNFVLPALMKAFNEEPGWLLSIHKNPTSFESACSLSKTRLRYIEDEHEVKVLKDGVLIEIIPKDMDTSSPPSCAVSTSISIYSETECDILLLEDLGITEKRIQRNIQGTLTNLCIVPSTTSSNELSIAIAKAVALKINSVLAEVQRSLFNWTDFRALEQFTSTDNLVRDITLMLNAFIKGKQSSTGQVSPSDQNINLASASTVGEAVTAVINTMDTCLDGQDSNKPAKTWLASVRTVVKYITCHSNCVDICPPHMRELEVHEELIELGGQSQIPMSISMDDFTSKDKMVASDVLNGKVESSLSASSSTGCAEEALDKMDHISKYFLQPIEETAADIIETFIGVVKSIGRPSTNRNPPVVDEALAQTLPSVHLPSCSARTNPIQTATKKVYCEVMLKLKVFFAQLPFHQSQTNSTNFNTKSELLAVEDIDSSDVDEDRQTPGPQRKSKSDQDLPLTKHLDPFVPCKVHSDSYCPFTQRELNACTKNVLKAVLASYISGQGTKTAGGGTSALLPSASSSVGDSLLFYLDDLTSASSSLLLSEDSFSTLSFSTTTENTNEEVNDLPIPSMKVLSSVKFQMNAFEEVTDILVNFLESHTSLKSSASSSNSCEKDDLTGIPWLEYFSKDVDTVAVDVIDSHVRCPSDESFSDMGSDDMEATITNAIHKLCQDDFHAEVSRDVGQVLLQSAETLTVPFCHLSIDALATDVVDTVVGGIEMILHTTSDSERNSSDKIGNKGRGLPNLCLRKVKHFNSVMVNGTCEMFLGLQEKVKNFFSNILQLDTNTNTEMYAKQIISNALIYIKEDILTFGESGYMTMVLDVLNLMFKNINGIDDQEGNNPKVTTRTLSMSTILSTPSTFVSGWKEQNSENIVPMVPVNGSAITQKCSRKNKSMETHFFAGKETAIKVVKMVSEARHLEDETSGSSQNGDLQTVAERIEKSLSRSVVNPQELVGKVYDLFMKDGSIVPRKSVSDTILTKFQDYEVLKKRIAFQLITSYAWETVNHLLLPCFKLTAPWTMEQADILAPTCFSFIMEGLVDEQDVPKPSKSPSEILTDILKVLTEAMVKDMMHSFSLSLKTASDHTKKTSAASYDQESMTSEIEQGGCSQEHMHAKPKQKPAEIEADNVACLGTVLMVRLLMTNRTETQSSDMAENSKQLMGRILPMLAAATSKSDTSADIQMTFRAVYHDLLREFGPGMILSQALEIKDSAFETALLTSLEKHISKYESEHPSLAESTSQTKHKKTKKGILQFLRKVPKLFRKKFGSGNKIGPARDNKSDDDIATESSDTVDPPRHSATDSDLVTEEPQPRQSSCFSKLIAALRRRKSRESQK